MEEAERTSRMQEHIKLASQERNGKHPYHPLSKYPSSRLLSWISKFKSRQTPITKSLRCLMRGSLPSLSQTTISRQLEWLQWEPMEEDLDSKTYKEFPRSHSMRVIIHLLSCLQEYKASKDNLNSRIRLARSNNNKCQAFKTRGTKGSSIKRTNLQRVASNLLQIRLEELSSSKDYPSKCKNKAVS